MAWKKEFNGPKCFNLYRKQQSAKSALKKWNKEVFGFCQSRINALTLQIQEIQKEDATEANCIQEARLQSELSEWLLRNEILWRQKSKETWFCEGDKNSKFFYLSTIIRKKHNTIDAVKPDSGEWITEKKEIKEYFLSKHMELFSEEEVESSLDLIKNSAHAMAKHASLIKNSLCCNFFSLPPPVLEEWR